MSAGSRTVTIRESDVDFENYSIRDDATPQVAGRPIDMRRFNFVQAPESIPEYADIYKAAHSQAVANQRRDPNIRVTVEAMRLADLMIAERQAQTKQVSKGGNMNQRSNSIHRKVADAPQPDLLSELFGSRPSGVVAPAPQGYAPSAQSAYATDPFAGLAIESPRAAAGDVLSITGFKRVPVGPLHAIRLSLGSGDVAFTMYCHAVYLNQTYRSEAVETVVAVYDRRWDGGQYCQDYLRRVYEQPRSGPCDLVIGDVFDGQVDLSTVSTFSVAEMVWAMELGDVGLVTFFVLEGS